MQSGNNFVVQDCDAGVTQNLHTLKWGGVATGGVSTYPNNVGMG